MTKLNPEIANIIHQYHLGSIILFRDNLIDSPQTVNLINALQQVRSNLLLFINVDLKTEVERNPELNRRIDESAYRIVFSKLKNKISATDKPVEKAQEVVAEKIDKDIENMLADPTVRSL
ncbi:MAG: hypothetical protein ACTS8R_02845 [Arsenophonus sp. NC-QC1-MAG3]